MDAGVSVLRQKHEDIREISLAIDHTLAGPLKAAILPELLDRLDTDITVYLALQQLVLFPRLKEEASALAVLLHERSSLRRLQQRLHDEVVLEGDGPPGDTVLTLLGLLLMLLEKEDRWLACVDGRWDPSSVATFGAGCRVRHEPTSGATMATATKVASAVAS